MMKNFKKYISILILISFVTSLITAPAGAQVVPFFGTMPVPGTPIGLTPGFQPPVLLGLKIHPENPLLFDFIVDQGASDLSPVELKNETEKLVKYFLAALTIPDKEAWVNLSPYEKDRIIPDVLSQTTMGKTMLEQDYILKQLASSLTNPEEKLGQEFWGQVRAKVGNENVEASTLSKVWIVPSKAEVLESQGIVLVGDKKLKVMMADEYEKRLSSDPSSDIFRSTILPNIEKEVNEGKNFADVRQIYNSVILATWYKKALKESLLGKVYTDKGKVAGVETDDKAMKQRIYEQYLEAFKKGVYNLIKEETDAATGETIPRKYFSGGLTIVPESVDVQSVPRNVIEQKLQASSGVHDAMVQLAAGQDERDMVSSKQTARTIAKLSKASSPLDLPASSPVREEEFYYSKNFLAKRMIQSIAGQDEFDKFPPEVTTFIAELIVAVSRYDNPWIADPTFKDGSRGLAIEGLNPDALGTLRQYKDFFNKIGLSEQITVNGVILKASGDFVKKIEESKFLFRIIVQRLNVKETMFDIQAKMLAYTILGSSDVESSLQHFDDFANAVAVDLTQMRSDEISFESFIFTLGQSMSYDPVSSGMVVAAFQDLDKAMQYGAGPLLTAEFVEFWNTVRDIVIVERSGPPSSKAFLDVSLNALELSRDILNADDVVEASEEFQRFTFAFMSGLITRDDPAALLDQLEKFGTIGPALKSSLSKILETQKLNIAVETFIRILGMTTGYTASASSALVFTDKVGAKLAKIKGGLKDNPIKDKLTEDLVRNVLNAIYGVYFIDSLRSGFQGGTVVKYNPKSDNPALKNAKTIIAAEFLGMKSENNDFVFKMPDGRNATYFEFLSQMQSNGYLRRSLGGVDEALAEAESVKLGDEISPAAAETVIRQAGITRIAGLESPAPLSAVLTFAKLATPLEKSADYSLATLMEVSYRLDKWIKLVSTQADPKTGQLLYESLLTQMKGTLTRLRKTIGIRQQSGDQNLTHENPGLEIALEWADAVKNGEMISAEAAEYIVKQSILQKTSEVPLVALNAIVEAADRNIERYRNRLDILEETKERFNERDSALDKLLAQKIAVDIEILKLPRASGSNRAVASSGVNNQLQFQKENDFNKAVMAYKTERIQRAYLTIVWWGEQKGFHRPYMLMDDLDKTISLAKDLRNEDPVIRKEFLSLVSVLLNYATMGTAGDRARIGALLVNNYEKFSAFYDLIFNEELTYPVGTSGAPSRVQNSTFHSQIVVKADAVLTEAQKAEFISRVRPDYPELTNFYVLEVWAQKQDQRKTGSGKIWNALIRFTKEKIAENNDLLRQRERDSVAAKAAQIVAERANVDRVADELMITLEYTLPSLKDLSYEDMSAFNILLREILYEGYYIYLQDETVEIAMGRSLDDAVIKHLTTVKIPGRAPMDLQEVKQALGRLGFEPNGIPGAGLEEPLLRNLKRLSASSGVSLKDYLISKLSSKTFFTALELGSVAIDRMKAVWAELNEYPDVVDSRYRAVYGGDVRIDFLGKVKVGSEEIELTRFLGLKTNPLDPEAPRSLVGPFYIRGNQLDKVLLNFESFENLPDKVTVTASSGVTNDKDDRSRFFQMMPSDFVRESAAIMEELRKRAIYFRDEEMTTARMVVMALLDRELAVKKRVDFNSSQLLPEDVSKIKSFISGKEKTPVSDFAVRAVLEKISIAIKDEGLHGKRYQLSLDVVQAVYDSLARVRSANINRQDAITKIFGDNNFFNLDQRRHVGIGATNLKALLAAKKLPDNTRTFGATRGGAVRGGFATTRGAPDIPEPQRRFAPVSGAEPNTQIDPHQRFLRKNNITAIGNVVPVATNLLDSASDTVKQVRSFLEYRNQIDLPAFLKYFGADNVYNEDGTADFEKLDKRSLLMQILEGEGYRAIGNEMFVKVLSIDEKEKKVFVLDEGTLLSDNERVINAMDSLNVTHVVLPVSAGQLAKIELFLKDTDLPEDFLDELDPQFVPLVVEARARGNIQFLAAEPFNARETSEKISWILQGSPNAKIFAFQQGNQVDKLLASFNQKVFKPPVASSATIEDFVFSGGFDRLDISALQSVVSILSLGIVLSGSPIPDFSEFKRLVVPDVSQLAPAVSDMILPVFNQLNSQQSLNLVLESVLRSTIRKQFDESKILQVIGTKVEGTSDYLVETWDDLVPLLVGVFMTGIEGEGISPDDIDLLIREHLEEIGVSKTRFIKTRTQVPQKQVILNVSGRNIPVFYLPHNVHINEEYPVDAVIKGITFAIGEQMSTKDRSKARSTMHDYNWLYEARLTSGGGAGRAYFVMVKDDKQNIRSVIILGLGTAAETHDANNQLPTNWQTHFNNNEGYSKAVMDQRGSFSGISEPMSRELKPFMAAASSGVYRFAKVETDVNQIRFVVDQFMATAQLIIKNGEDFYFALALVSDAVRDYSPETSRLLIEAMQEKMDQWESLSDKAAATKPVTKNILNILGRDALILPADRWEDNKQKQDALKLVAGTRSAETYITQFYDNLRTATALKTLTPEEAKFIAVIVLAKNNVKWQIKQMMEWWEGRPLLRSGDVKEFLEIQNDPAQMQVSRDVLRAMNLEGTFFNADGSAKFLLDFDKQQMLQTIAASSGVEVEERISSVVGDIEKMLEATKDFKEEGESELARLSRAGIESYSAFRLRRAQWPVDLKAVKEDVEKYKQSQRGDLLAGILRTAEDLANEIRSFWEFKDKPQSWSYLISGRNVAAGRAELMSTGKEIGRYEFLSALRHGLISQGDVVIVNVNDDAPVRIRRPQRFGTIEKIVAPGLIELWGANKANLDLNGVVVFENDNVSGFSLRDVISARLVSFASSGVTKNEQRNAMLNQPLSDQEAIIDALQAGSLRVGDTVDVLLTQYDSKGEAAFRALSGKITVINPMQVKGRINASTIIRIGNVGTKVENVQSMTLTALADPAVASSGTISEEDGTAEGDFEGKFSIQPADSRFSYRVDVVDGKVTVVKGLNFDNGSFLPSDGAGKFETTFSVGEQGVVIGLPADTQFTFSVTPSSVIEGGYHYLAKVKSASSGVVLAKSENIKIADRKGIHWRSAAKLVNLKTKFPEFEIFLSYQARYDVRKVKMEGFINMVGLQIPQTSVTVELGLAEGYEDSPALRSKADEFLKAFKDILQTDFSGSDRSPFAASSSVSKDQQEYGGIDFDPANMNLQIKRDGKGVPLPLPQQNLEQINIPGLFPVIINIVPVNSQTLPVFLGQAAVSPLPSSPALPLGNS